MATDAAYRGHQRGRVHGAICIRNPSIKWTEGESGTGRESSAEGLYLGDLAHETARERASGTML